MNQEIDVNFEPLPGYRLIERIGAGGYGEVWRAEAPGGLTKAIKFVFGTQHEKRACNEMRALDHVRGVRHPFLLSLERIEIVDGRLLVVTELADKSIKDRFDFCRREGLRGIPRDELLGYLRDTADALDFMSDAHALQHLDIKPENLLLLADHVKVADFGLVKDVRQSQASLVGGMTPLYAAPEVFRGVPSRYSDQYSLAIVYQEMLTGTLPFAGGNAAELTLQHLNDEPDLSALATSDRYAVSRALSKDPQHRYATCREFVESLAKVAATPTQFQPDSPAADFDTPREFAGDASEPIGKTEFFDEGESANWQSAPQLLAELPTTDCRLINLPPIDLTGRDVRPMPTLILGIGGSAGRVLSQFRGMIHEQFSGRQLPAVQLLLIDTDTQSQASAGEHDARGLTPDEILNLPLRRPQHYRDNSQQLLHWLSRRWLYNIPRSLRTEGLRPLGRLALVDHARQAGQRIRRAMSQAVDPQAIAATSAASAQDFRPGALRVVVVASISGGTGGGMSLDMGYAVRAILQKLAIADASVVGIMMHSTDRDARQAELARVNAFSWLSEFNHFQQLQNAYPGDTSCGLPAHPAGVAAFDQTYLLHLGEGLEDTEFNQATQAVADYLRLTTLSPAGAFSEACRRTPLNESTTPHETPTLNLRSFGLSRRTAASREFCDNIAGAISQQVLSSWVGIDSNPRAAVGKNPSKPPLNLAPAPAVPNGDPDCIQFIQRLQLDSANIVKNARVLVDLQLGADLNSFLTGWLEKFETSTQDGVAQLRAVDQIFSGGYEGAGDGEISMLGTSTCAIVAPLAEKLRSELRRWLTRRIDDPAQRLTGARRAVKAINEHLLETRSQLQQRQSTLTSNIFQRNAETAADAAPNHKTFAVQKSDRAATVREYFALSLDRTATLAAQSAIGVLLSEIKAFSDEITALAREIDQITSAVGRAVNPLGAAGATEGTTGCSPSESRLAAEITAKLPEIARQVDVRLQAEYLESTGGLINTIMQGGRPRAQLAAKLYELSREAVYQALAGVDVLQSDSANAGDSLKSTLAMATPALLEYGGRRRVLTILPREAASQAAQAAISERLGMSVSTIAGVDSSFTICVEADGLSLTHIALDFVERRRDRVEFAGRVHCRTDIVWTPFIATNSHCDSAIWSTDDPRRTQSQHEMSKTVVL